jgi:hypothetical protein
VELIVHVLLYKPPRENPGLVVLSDVGDCVVVVEPGSVLLVLVPELNKRLPDRFLPGVFKL